MYFHQLKRIDDHLWWHLYSLFRELTIFISLFAARGCLPSLGLWFPWLLVDLFAFHSVLDILYLSAQNPIQFIWWEVWAPLRCHRTGCVTTASKVGLGWQPRLSEWAVSRPGHVLTEWPYSTIRSCLRVLNSCPYLTSELPGRETVGDWLPLPCYWKVSTEPQLTALLLKGKHRTSTPCQL